MNIKSGRGSAQLRVSDPDAAARLGADVQAEAKRKRERKQPGREGALLTLKQAADLLDVSVATLRRYVDEGSLRYIDMTRHGSVRRRMKFDRQDLENFKARRSRIETARCPSNAKARPTISSTSKSEVYDFAALRDQRASTKRKP
ncbi:MAG: helix-turn-helix domain-containing protein [Methyloceanibacter sp.]|uniref:helix-turn-helix domain-containing protein n=1 Tax=Methyloceanibacter sp. TaxID=1965321 RepID=UPI001D457201|nr:helix-turn-helix domain-containing protein [Methyloceanibacter sp.]MCC0058094.1 helix-turn-helix domain-containing protein [Hyphomicrobiaceae bacterium]